MHLMKLLLLICMVIASSSIQASQSQCLGQGQDCSVVNNCCPGYECKQLKFKGPKICAIYGGR